MKMQLPATIRDLGLEDSAAIERAITGTMPPKILKALHPESKYRDGQFDGIGRYRIDAELTVGEIDTAIAALDAGHIPAPPAFIAAELTRVFLATKSREAASDEMQMRVAIYIEELADLPADAIRNGCRAWSRSEKFTPSLAELREYCLRFCKSRWLMRAALCRAKWRLEKFGSVTGTAA